jgi:FKBP-type peptidyl-prolyl cis-trans isomerase FkpA
MIKRAALLCLPILLTSCSSTAPPDAEASKAYLEKAAAVPGAVRTPSGLIYRELRPGTGTSPLPTDTVKVNYRGTLIDGKKFDSSENIKFPLNRVIPCWTEGVQRMKVGGKSELVCPASIAYGAQGQPPDIPGGATLIFEIELLGIGQ